MFEAYQESQRRRWSSGKIAMVVVVTVIAMIGVRAALLHRAEQRDADSMNQMFVSAVRGAHTIQRGRVAKADDSVHPGAVVSWPCPERQVTGYAYVMQWGTRGLEDGISLALTARCYGADEPLPKYE
jgi:hypothetical protein